MIVSTQKKIYTQTKKKTEVYRIDSCLLDIDSRSPKTEYCLEVKTIDTALKKKTRYILYVLMYSCFIDYGSRSSMGWLKR